MPGFQALSITRVPSPEISPGGVVLPDDNPTEEIMPEDARMTIGELHPSPAIPQNWGQVTISD